MRKVEIIALVNAMKDSYMILRRYPNGGWYGPELSEVISSVYDHLGVENLDPVSLVETMDSLLQANEFIEKYELTEFMIENVLHQKRLYDWSSDYGKLSEGAKEISDGKNVLELIESNLSKAKSIAERRLEEEKAKPKEVESGYIYVIKSELGFKIGKTNNIESRNKIFSVKMPFEWDFEYYYNCKDYHHLEKMLHNKYKSKNINGEWFNLDPSDVADIKNMLLSQEIR